MKRIACIILCICSLWGLPACAQNPPARAVGADRNAVPPTPSGSATQPADPRPAGLPAGHPDISRMLAEQAQATAPPTSRPALPMGHPDIPQARPPVLPGGQITLPKGHPDLSQLRGRMPESGMPFGKIKIKVEQGTPGGPKISAEPVMIEMFNEGNVIDRISKTLDANGELEINDIPVAVRMQPVVTIMHAGVPYRADGLPMDSQHLEQTTRITVFETTDQEPQWAIRMRHLIVHNSPEALHVIEMLAIENTADRTWLGKAGDDGKRTTLVLPLPGTAAGVHLVNGFNESMTRIEGGKLVTSTPLSPGTSRWQISYMIPVNNSEAHITVAAPTAVKHMMIFVPDDGSTVTTEGLESGGTTKGEHGNTRLYKAVNQIPGQIASITISGVKSPDKTAASSWAGSSDMAQMIAGAGVVLILLVCVAIFFIRKPTAAKKDA